MEQKAARKVHKNKGKKIFAIIMILLLVALVAAVVFMQTHKVNTISDNIYINTLAVGGMNLSEATELIEKEFGTDYFKKNVEVKYDDKTYEADLFGLVTIDAEETAKEALNKSNSLWERLFKSEKVVVPFDLNTKEDELRNNLLDFARKTDVDSGVFKFNEDYTMVDVDSSKQEKLIDTEKTIERIIDNAELNIFEKIDAVIVDRNNEDYIDELYHRLSKPAINASIGMNDDGSTYIVPEEYGIIVNEDRFEDLFEGNDGVFSMEIKSVEPEIKTSDLDIEFYQDVLGEYTSAYNVGLVNRTKNVSLAARLVNGTVVMPGDRFSYNGVVGKRTYERGFVDATVYTGEGTEEGIGGGICQVSSTIYCAQLRADLKTVSRSNHSYTVVYVPLGQDATVVYGALDYVFENSTNFPIKIVANANGGYLNVKILGTKIDKSQTVDVVSVTQSTVAKGEVQTETPDLLVGQTEVKQEGQNGAVVNTYKVYYKNGIEQKREFVSKSTYRPMNKIILIGTGVEEETENTESEQIPGNDTGKENGVDKETQAPEDESADVFGEDNIETELEGSGNEKPAEDELPTSDTGL